MTEQVITPENSWYWTPQVHYAVEWLNGVPAKLHLITVPGLGQRGGEKQGVALSRFDTHHLEDWYNNFYTKNVQCPRRFHVRHQRDWDLAVQSVESARRRIHEADIEHFKRTGIHREPYKDQMDGVPELKHRSVWAFFRTIGYSQKTRTFDP